MQTDFGLLAANIADLKPLRRVGYVSSVQPGSLAISGLSGVARIGDSVSIRDKSGALTEGEIIALDRQDVTVMLYSGDVACGVGDEARLLQKPIARPNASWMGRVVDAFGQPIDGKPISQGANAVELRRSPPNAAERRSLGSRLDTGYGVLDTFLPLARGQRIGIFAGSGVGKTSLVGGLAKSVSADVVVLGLIGERGRELREFIDVVLGPEGQKRSVIVAATSDQSPLLKRRAAWMATSIAEVFRDMGMQVLLIVDSLTRFAEAHREIALTAGETPSLRAFPPSTVHMIASLSERAGTGTQSSGDITAVYSVLVAGSDMEEPVADFARGVLDGHIILDRAIAERGRFPAIDIGRSVSRSLPAAATPEENQVLKEARKLIGTYIEAEPLIKTGLYTSGSDPQIDLAAAIWPKLDQFAAVTDTKNVEDSFSQLRLAMSDAFSQHVEDT